MEDLDSLDLKPQSGEPDPEPEPEGEPTEPESKEIDDPKAELEKLRAELEEKDKELQKLSRDNSSLKGQVKPQQDVLSEYRDDMSALRKQMELITKHWLSGDQSEEAAQEFAQVESDLVQTRANRRLEAFYDSAVEEVKQAIIDEDGNQLIDLESDGDEVEAIKSLWREGQSGKSGERVLSADERISKLNQAVGEIHKLARKEERRLAKEKAEKEKSERQAARKKERDESGELDLDTGPGGASAGEDFEGKSGRDMIDDGLKRMKETGKKSRFFVEQ